MTEISSAVTRTGKQEHFTPDALHHETDHLPRGVKVTIANPQGGTRARQMRTVTVNGVAGEASATGSPTVILNPTPGELWVGTGPTYKGSARITELKVGTSHNRYGITHGGRVLSATKVIAIGFRVSSLPSGSGMGAVLGQVARTCARDARLTGR